MNIFDKENLLYGRNGHFGLRYSDFDSPCSRWEVGVTKENNGFAVWIECEGFKGDSPTSWHGNREEAIEAAVGHVEPLKVTAKKDFKKQCQELYASDPKSYINFCGRYGMQNVLEIKFDPATNEEIK